jgi:hypothetical protein
MKSGWESRDKAVQCFAQRKGLPDPAAGGDLYYHGGCGLNEIDAGQRKIMEQLDATLKVDMPAGAQFHALR